MTQLADVRAGLAKQISLTGLRIGPGGEWPDQVVPPAALVKLVGQEFEQGLGFGGDARGRLQVEIHLALAVKGGLVAAQQAIERYLSNSGSDSLYLALTSDRHLGQIANSLFVRGWRAEDTVEINDAVYLGAIVDVEIDVS